VVPRKLPPRVLLPPRDPKNSPGGQECECTVRGYHGPFVNTDFYNAFPDPFWHGFGDCVVCHSTCRVLAEEVKRQQAHSSPQPPSA